ncbi:Uncharacterised protein [Mycobacteroides abscessus subsp. abscessus]|nr:Uncharacterised protein [Mycobacteroides abscessus subsp. abscessus]
MNRVASSALYPMMSGTRCDSPRSIASTGSNGNTSPSMLGPIRSDSPGTCLADPISRNSAFTRSFGLAASTVAAAFESLAPRYFAN